MALAEFHMVFSVSLRHQQFKSLGLSKSSDRSEFPCQSSENKHLLGLQEFNTGATKPLQQNIFREFRKFV
jgi:hypothetical protein